MILMTDFFRKFQFHSILRFLIRCDPPTQSRVNSLLEAIYKTPPEGLSASTRPCTSK